MCGIFALLNSQRKDKESLARSAGNLLRHRGPDHSGQYINDNTAIAHERLSIVGVSNGSQPIVEIVNGNKLVLAVNGEIYNYKQIYEQINGQLINEGKELFRPTTQSDCEAIMALFAYLSLTSQDHPQWMVDEKTYRYSGDGNLSGNSNGNKIIDPLYEDQLKRVVESTIVSNRVREDVRDKLLMHSDRRPNGLLIERLLNTLDGDFAFVLLDETRNFQLVARDPIGVFPLYYGYNPNYSEGTARELSFASELKALKDFKVVKVFPPGAYYDGQLFSDGTPYIKYYFRPNWRFNYLRSGPQWSIDDRTAVLENIRTKLTTAVEKRLMADVPFGVLLSGGLDSSLITAIANNLCKEKYGVNYKLKTFSISLANANSTDEAAAKKVAEYLQTDHYHFHFTLEEGLDALYQLIYHLESYDITTVRASMPMFLLSKRIHAMNIKMVLSGEGSDEIFGGYLYFHNAPNDSEFKLETVRRVNNLHLSDCLRANKSTMAWALEARVPFLDKDFLNYVMELDPTIFRPLKKEIDNQNIDTKLYMEKNILRFAFENKDGASLLPNDILWRQKEQFSDGVGYGWIDTLKSYSETKIMKSEMAIASSLYPYETPTTKEGFFYRMIFESQYPEQMAKTVKSWIPTWGASKDPSGRAQSVHVATNLTENKTNTNTNIDTNTNTENNPSVIISPEITIPSPGTS